MSTVAKLRNNDTGKRVELDSLRGAACLYRNSRFQTIEKARRKIEILRRAFLYPLNGKFRLLYF